MDTLNNLDLFPMHRIIEPMIVCLQPKIQVASKYERRVDTRSYDDKKKLFEGVSIIVLENKSDFIRNRDRWSIIEEKRMELGLYATYEVLFLIQCLCNCCVTLTNEISVSFPSISNNKR